MPQSRACSGFTLIELLVVIAIMGLITSVVVPKLYHMEERLRHSIEKDSLLGELDELSYRAYIQGKRITLATSGIDSATPYPLDLPQGWRVVLPHPIEYDFNGVCSGGSLTLIAPDDSSETISLQSPRCAASPNSRG